MAYELEAQGWLLGDAEEWHAYIRKLKLMQKARRSSLVMGARSRTVERVPGCAGVIEVSDGSSRAFASRIGRDARLMHYLMSSIFTALSADPMT